MRNDIVFKGLIEGTGTIKSIELANDKSEVYIMIIEAYELCNYIKIGDKVAVNGVCLSIIDSTEHEFTVHIWEQTQIKTNLLQLKTGDFVNLERNRYREESGASSDCPY